MYQAICEHCGEKTPIYGKSIVSYQNGPIDWRVFADNKKVVCDNCKRVDGMHVFGEYIYIQEFENTLLSSILHINESIDKIKKNLIENENNVTEYRKIEKNLNRYNEHLLVLTKKYNDMKGKKMEIKMGIMDEGDLYDIANMAISLLFQNKKNGTIVNSVSFKYKDKEYKLNKDESISMFQKRYPEFGLNDSNGVSFIDEEDKIEDMKILTKDEFLKSYDYLTVDDYFATIKDLAIKDEKWIMFLMKPRANVKVNIWDNTMSEKLKNSLTLPYELKYLFINAAKDYEEFEKLIEKYVNEQPSLAHLSHRGNMKQFYDRAICDFEN